MLSFPSQNNNFFPDQPGVLKKADTGESKPTYF